MASLGHNELMLLIMEQSSKPQPIITNNRIICHMEQTCQKILLKFESFIQEVSFEGIICNFAII